MISIGELKIYVFYGKKGQGKSQFCAKLAWKLIHNYFRTEKKYPLLPKRILYTNQKMSEAFEKLAGEHLKYWSNPKQLYNIRDSDIIWDEIGKDLPTGSYKDCPRKLKQVFSHLRRRGNRCFANSQLYEDIDISFRRQIDYAFQIKKLFSNRDVSATLPAPKYIFGLYRLTEFDPMFLENEWDETKREQKPKTKLLDQLWPLRNWHWISRKWCDLYDTKAEIPAYMPDSLSEIIQTCEEGINCKKKMPDGKPHMVIRHEPI